MPALPTNFCLTGSIGTENYVLANSNPGANIFGRPIGAATPATLRLTINSQGNLITPSNGYKAYVVAPLNNPQVVRFGMNPNPSQVLICTGSYGGLLSCIVPTGQPIGTYRYFYRSDNNNGVVLMATSVLEPSSVRPIAWTLSTVCPA